MNGKSDSHRHVNLTEWVRSDALSGEEESVKLSTWSGPGVENENRWPDILSRPRLSNKGLAWARELIRLGSSPINITVFLRLFVVYFLSSQVRLISLWGGDMCGIVWTVIYTHSHTTKFGHFYIFFIYIFLLFKNLKLKYVCVTGDSFNPYNMTTLTAANLRKDTKCMRKHFVCIKERGKELTHYIARTTREI